MFSLEQCAMIVAALGNAVIATYIFSRKPSNTLHRAFLFFGIGAALWGGGIGLLSPTSLIHIEKWIFLGGGMMSVSFFVLSCTLARRDRLSWIESTAATLFIASFVGIPLNLYVAGVAVSASGRHVAAVFGPYGEIYLAAIFGFMLVGLLRLIKTCVSLESWRRRPVYYFLLGATTFIACMTIFDILLPILGVADLNFLGPISLLAFTGITGYAIVQHQLMDIRIVIQRGLIYTALLSLIVALYVFLIHTFDLILDRDDGIIFGAGISTTVISIFGVPVIERYFRRMTDKVFFKDKYDYALALESLSEILHTSIDFDELIARMQENLARILRAESAEIILHGDDGASVAEKTFENDIREHRKLYERIRLDSKEIGSILIHEKRSGDRYTKEDEQLLRTFSLQASTALARAQLFKQVQEYALELENKVASRTRELREAQENQKQMMLDIAHNLQTPLAVFQTKLENLRSARQTEIDVDTFEQSLMSLSDFIDNLLKLAELERRTIETHFDRFSLSSLIEEIAEEVEIIAIARNIRITRDIAPDIEIRGDTKELRSAIMNLAGNAIKYMSPLGKREIAFRLTRDDTQVCLSVRDTGIGISAEDLSHIFDRFYRLDNSDGVSGNGLGLAISKRVFERHGATVIAKSVIDEGTEMIVYFPMSGA